MTAKTAGDGDRAFFGHPKALGYLAFTEAWERFSYYGMQGLLVLYMTKSLLLAPHVDQIWGFEGFRAFIQLIYRPGPSTQDVASTITPASSISPRSWAGCWPTGCWARHARSCWAPC